MRKARKEIQASQVEELAFIGSTLFEMAIFLDCSEDTLYRRFHKVIKKGIVRRTIFLRRQRFDLAMKGNAAAFKWFSDACVGEPSEQSKELQLHEKAAATTIEESIERVLAGDKKMEELIAKYPDLKELVLAQRARLRSKTPQDSVESWDVR
jgi:hypothetical protein